MARVKCVKPTHNEQAANQSRLRETRLVRLRPFYLWLVGVEPGRRSPLGRQDLEERIFWFR